MQRPLKFPLVISLSEFKRMLQSVSGGFNATELRELLQTVLLNGEPLEIQFIEPNWRIFPRRDGPHRCLNQNAVYAAAVGAGRIIRPAGSSAKK